MSIMKNAINDIEIDDIVLVAPPELSEQSYKLLGKIYKIEPSKVIVETLYYLDTKSKSEKVSNRYFYLDEYHLKENYKKISIDDFINIHPEYFI